MKKIFSFLIVVLFFTSIVHAATYYVATTGDNGDPGTEAQPWLTLTYAESQLSNGDTVIVRGGTYNETFTINVANVTFQNYPSETPIIDGEDTLPGGDQYNSLVIIANVGGGITFDGFEIKNSTARGIGLAYTDNNIIKNCAVHDIKEAGIVIDTDANNILVEDCVVHEHNLQYLAGGGWGSGIGTARNHDITIRGCEVYNGCGEGIIAGRQSANVTVEYCTVYDNRALQIYADTTKDVTIRYNLAYGTRNATYNTRYTGTTAGTGISVAVEAPAVGYGDGAEIYGNLVADCLHGLEIWDITNVKIYNNTVVEAYYYNSTPTLLMIDGSLTDHIVRNNIFIQTNGTIAVVPNAGTYSNNLWSKTPEADAQGEGDVIGSPLLAKTSGWNSLTAGAVDGSEFVLQDSSPAINVGVDLGSPYNLGLNPTSTWPDSVSTLDQDGYGIWEIGGFVYTGTILPVVTTQATTDITTTTAIGHGTITDVGGESNCTKRGICWNTTGSPTVADDKKEFVGSFPAEAFSGNMTSLTPDQAYFARAYAYNTGGYGYGSTEGFNTDADANGTYIIDDGDAETSSTGTWSASGGANPYGSGSLYCHAVNSTYTYEKTLDGNYTVSLWWTEYASRSSSVTVKIYDSGDNLLDTKSVNQTTLGGQWNEQDTYDFNATAKVMILSTGGGPPNVSTCADAVKFDYVEGSGGEDINNLSRLYGINLQGCGIN